MTSIFPIVYDIFYFVFLKWIEGKLQVNYFSWPPPIDFKWALVCLTNKSTTHNSIIFLSLLKFNSFFDPPTTNKFETINSRVWLIRTLFHSNLSLLPFNINWTHTRVVGKNNNYTFCLRCYWLYYLFYNDTTEWCEKVIKFLSFFEWMNEEFHSRQLL